MKVSVVIPCYNGEEYIGQAIGSVLEQSHPAHEIILVDDGSTDRSVEIALNFGEHVKVLSKGGGGAANARNFGADYASGEAIMFLDADDVLGPDVIKHLTTQLKKNPEGVVACPWFRLQKIENSWFKRPRSCFPLGDNQDHLSGWLTGWWHPPCSVLWSRSAYKKTGGWDPLAYVNDDGDLMMRALVDGINLEITNKGASFYRRMPAEKVTESLSGARFTRKGRESQIYVIRKIAQRLYDRDKLHPYRKSITYKLNKFRKLCMTDYPDLSETCLDLIKRYGVPLHIRVHQTTKKKFRQIAQSGMNKISNLLSNYGFDRTKRTLKRMKYYNFAMHSEEESAQSGLQEKDTEITYGVNAFQNAIKNKDKGKIIVPANPVISVILIASNSLFNLKSALKSVLNQFYDDFEILVMMSESSEKDNFILKHSKDSRIRFISVSESSQISVAMNTAFRVAKGEFIAFMDSNDEWFPSKLPKEIDLFRKSPENVKLIYSDIKCIDDEGKFSIIRPELKNKSNQRLLTDDMNHGISGITIHRNVLASTGFFDDRLPNMEIRDYLYRVARYHKFAYTEEILLKYYNSSGFKQNSSHSHSENE